MGLQFFLAMINYEIRIITRQPCFVNAQLHCDQDHTRVAIRHAYNQNYNTLNCQRMTSIRIWHDQIRYRVCFNFTLFFFYIFFSPSPTSFVLLLLRCLAFQLSVILCCDKISSGVNIADCHFLNRKCFNGVRNQKHLNTESK